MISPAERVPELDKYELFEEIGHGGMATVYRGYDRRLDREVAIKIIHRHLRENHEVAARFVSEAKAVAKVKHGNIVEVYDVSGPDEGERYLVVELVRGTTLRWLLADQGHLPAEIAAAIGLEIADGLEHAHLHGVVHRDVKPENVLVERPLDKATSAQEGESSRLPARIKITDFGIAKLLDAQGVTSTGQVLGSPAHMSPEQIEGGEVSARSDVFGLAVLLYECMVGKLPFDGKNPAQVLRRVLDGAFTVADRARPTVGAGFARVLGIALAREPEGRYASASEFAHALREELRRVGFDEPRRELEQYLADPRGYLDGYESRIVSRLVALGRQARAERQVTLAAASFNRALAFRPADAELLGLVSGLSRAERMRRMARRLGAVAVAAMLLGLGVLVASRMWARRAPAVHLQDDPRTRPSPLVPKAEQRGPLITGGQPPTNEPSRDVPKKPRMGSSVPGPAPRQRATRLVQVHIRGAAGSLQIDGTETPWYGRTHALELGRHVLVFVPPNQDCCIVPAPKTIEVVAGEGVQQEGGEIRFKDATLTFSGPVGAEASCAELAAHLSPGSSKAVQLSGPELSINCTVFPPPEEGQNPKTQTVTLRPGVTAVLSWP